MDFALATVLPLITLGALGAVLPIAIASRFSDTQAGLAKALALSAVLALLAGSALFVAMYNDGGMTLAALALAPLASLGHFLGLGLKAALIWGPVMALTAFVLAQGVERRRGERLAARDPD